MGSVLDGDTCDAYSLLFSGKFYMQTFSIFGIGNITKNSKNDQTKQEHKLGGAIAVHVILIGLCPKPVGRFEFACHMSLCLTIYSLNIPYTMSNCPVE